MHGPNFDLTVTEITTNNADHTFVTSTESVIVPNGGAAVITKDEAYGTWHLEGNIVTTEFLKSTFLSSSDPSVGKEIGQRIQDEQLKKKSIYQSRILELSDDKSRSIPVNPMYKEAAVESSCHRIR